MQPHTSRLRRQAKTVYGVKEVAREIEHEWAPTQLFGEGQNRYVPPRNEPGIETQRHTVHVDAAPTFPGRG
ncbi:MAG: hypothetical protein M3173_06435 [Chloroflexota bacterium]|nr:hypothetical protein [Chloroflexota bacterium]